MIRNILACLAAYCLVSASHDPAWAEAQAGASSQAASSPQAPSTGQSNSLSPTANTSQPNASNSQVPATSKPGGPVNSSLPKRALGLVCGTVVGTPVCVVRKSIDEEAYAVNGMVSDTSKKKARMLAGFFWLPFAVFTGAVEAPVFAARNSLKAEEPFSKEQFSLSDVQPKAPATP
jgi:hypothetical protein